MRENRMLTRTEAALGKQLMDRLASLRFCVVGCGGTGATFAEMLVRSGAKNMALVDGDRVDSTNLNRVFSFVPEDTQENKAEILKKRLETINPEINVCSFAHHLLSEENIVKENPLPQKARDCVYDSHVVFIGTDTNESRMACEKLCRDKPDKMYLSCGVGVENEKSFFECYWKPDTPEEKKDAEGYGPENASYISIVTEAASVAFSMLIHHLKNSDSDKFRQYYKEYDANFTISKIELDHKNLQLQ